MKVVLAATVLGLVVTCAGLLGARTPLEPTAMHPVWTEVSWPFPMDQWGAGKAFVCAAADCGARVRITVRPKIGYCNCATGVSDDAELERVSDNDLAGRAPRGLGSGRPVKVGWMSGLSRAYRDADGANGADFLSVAFNDDCDVVVALAMVGGADPSRIEPAVLSFLNSRDMVLWTKKELGLEFVRRDW